MASPNDKRAVFVHYSDETASRVEEGFPPRAEFSGAGSGI